VEQIRDRVAVVTGGASGIGLGMARALAGAGAKLVLADIEQEPLEAAARGLADDGADVVGVVCDVADPKSVDRLRDETLSAFGAVHVLCNNAGVGGDSTSAIWEQPAGEWDWVMGVNLRGVIHGIQRFMPLMVEQGAGIYGVTKHAVVALSESIYRDVQMRGLPIGVSVLCPGWVNTRIMESGRNRPEAPRPAEAAPNPMLQQFFDAFAEQVRNGMDPDEVGRLVVAAIEEERFYVLPHRWEEMIRNRLEHILEGKNPVPIMAPGLAGDGAT
jgi:NAD(P)-dependent dehydrogenase (short-subunit alcohol dehydrogenase family)